MSDMPAAKINGSEITAVKGRPWAAAPAEMASSATSEAVSNPRPNRKPIGYICQLCSITRNSLPNSFVITPPVISSRSSDSRSYSPRRIFRYTRTMSIRITRFSTPIKTRNPPETRVPTAPPTFRNSPLPPTTP